MKYPAIFEQLEQKIHAKIMRPYKLSDMSGDYPKDVLREIYQSNPCQLDFMQFDCIFDALQEERVYYLTDILRFMYDKRENYFSLIFRTVTGVQFSKEYLIKIDAFELAQQCLKEIFFHWISNFKISSQASIYKRTLGGAEARNDYLFQKMGEFFPEMAAAIFEQWNTCFYNHCWSAHLIDVLLYVRKEARYNKPFVNFGNGIFETILIDSQLLRKHFNLARECWDKANLPEYYKKEIEKFSQYISSIEENE